MITKFNVSETCTGSLLQRFISRFILLPVFLFAYSWYTCHTFLLEKWCTAAVEVVVVVVVVVVAVLVGGGL